MAIVEHKQLPYGKSTYPDRCQQSITTTFDHKCFPEGILLLYGRTQYRHDGTKPGNLPMMTNSGGLRTALRLAVLQKVFS